MDAIGGALQSAIGTPQSALPTPHSPIGKIRIGRALSLLGWCSRREAERLVQSGRIAVNGAFTLSPAARVEVGVDIITVDGVAVPSPGAFQYYALHKPRGVVSTVTDPHAKTTVVQLVPSTTRLYPVGRLDKDSEGLILLTNDGAFAHRVMHPRHLIEREYWALVAQSPHREALDRLRQGMDLDGRLARPLRVSAGTQRPGGPWVCLIMGEGRHHEVRRMLSAVGLAASRLVRTRIGNLRLGTLAPGAYRKLRPSEVQRLVQPGRVRASIAEVRDQPPPQPLGQARGGLPPGKGERPGFSPSREGSEARPLPPVPGGLSGGSAPRIKTGGRVGSLVIAVDGPSAAGKTAVGRLLAQRLGAAFLDTGIFYRGLAVLAIERGVAPDDGPALAALVPELAQYVTQAGWRVAVRGELSFGGPFASPTLRSPEVDATASRVAAHGEVRSALLALQRLAARAGRLVAVGRDTGTVVFPDAHLKVYLDASLAERARRRALEGRGAQPLGQVKEDLASRDARDEGRELAPLARATDAVVVATDGLSIEAVVGQIQRLLVKRVQVPHG